MSILSQSFEVRALVAGGLVALACGMVGYFLLLRSQVFAADALSHVSFTGAVMALAAGVDLRFGLFGGCVGFAAALALLGRRSRPDDVTIGNAFAWVLGLGALFLTVYSRSGAAAGDGVGGVNVLFGSVYSLGWSAALVAAGIVAAVTAMGRPLLFASIDEAAAEAAGTPVRVLGLAFLVVVGVTAGEATQAVGALLLLGLLSAPAAAAHRLARNPWVALPLSGLLALAAMWLGLWVAFELPRSRWRVPTPGASPYPARPCSGPSESALHRTFRLPASCRETW
jgi:zinc/manganese transport system permease protein